MTNQGGLKPSHVLPDDVRRLPQHTTLLANRTLHAQAKGSIGHETSQLNNHNFSKA